VDAGERLRQVGVQAQELGRGGVGLVVVGDGADLDRIGQPLGGGHAVDGDVRHRRHVDLP
jgi:hypothetical protein